MKKPLLLLTFFFSILITHAQIKAVTNNGDEVILNTDGTWKYVNDSLNDAGKSKVDTSKISYNKNAAASFLVKSNRVSYGVYLDPKKWSFEKKTGDGASEYEFHTREKDLYGMMISEKIEMPLETLKVAAFKNAQDAASDIKIVKEEYRRVNGNLVLMLQMNGTIRGIKFCYFGYYYSSSKGTVQLLTYTSANLMDEYRKELELFLNGFVVL